MHLMGNKESGEKLKKDNIRDYATEAFRFYAACGKLTAEQLKQKIYDDIYEQSRKEYLRSGSGMPVDATAYAVIAAEKALGDMRAEFEDIIAVEKTLWRLRRQAKQAVEIVYFTDADKPLCKGDISERVQRASIQIPADVSAVYEWLWNARKIFAEERGLRTTKKEYRKVTSSKRKKDGNMVSSNSEGA